MIGALSAVDRGPAGPAPKLLEKIDVYWRAAECLSVGQIYLHDNPALRRSLDLSHAKPRDVSVDLPEIRDWQWNPPQQP